MHTTGAAMRAARDGRSILRHRMAQFTRRAVTTVLTPRRPAKDGASNDANLTRSVPDPSDVCIRCTRPPRMRHRMHRIDKRGQPPAAGALQLDPVAQAAAATIPR